MTRLCDYDAQAELGRIADKYLDEPEPTLYPYRVRVEVIQYYDVEVDAVDESDAYEKASEIVYSPDFDELDLYDEKVEFISCEEV